MLVKVPEAKDPVSMPNPEAESWVEVVKRKGKKIGSSKSVPSTVKQPEKQSSKTAPSKPQKLRTPRTAAVVITLEPEAEKSGITYQQVMLRARKAVETEKLEIPPVRIRESATGARLVEISGPSNAEKADIVAVKLKETLGDVAKVTRPVKTAELRLAGLDDSITTKDVISAISTKGKCLSDCVRTGEIRRGPGGMGTVWVQCPVIAAKVISEEKRILIGWTYMDELTEVVRRMAQRQVLVMGDLNAKATDWGSPRTDARGRVVCEWAAATGLVLLNRGTELTCVRQRGGSIVDVTFASPSVADRVRDWRVMVDEETLSDHRYIRFDIFSSSSLSVDSNRRTRATVFPRWCLTKLNKELALEAAIVEANWNKQSVSDAVENSAVLFGEAMSRICDSAMPRAGPRPPRRQVYWWTAEIADLRRDCVSKHRAFTRHRRRRVRDDEEEARLLERHSETKKALRTAISWAKTLAYTEMLEGLDRDLWGRPYRTIRAKFAKGPPVVDCMDPQLLDTVVKSLFPQQSEHVPPSMDTNRTESAVSEPPVPTISDEEFNDAIHRLRAKNKAPGPDGIPGRVLALSVEYLEDQLRSLYNACLTSRSFPDTWKVGRLVLLQKPGKPPNIPSAYRPIVLLDEAGKLLERIVADRIVRHLTNTGPNLAEAQHGFREGRSTINAIISVRAFSDEEVNRSGVVVAVSLDI
jgi:hypothetical protein